MPLNQHGQYFANPKHGEMADKMENQPHDDKGKGEPSKKGHVEVHKGDQGYKTVSHNQDGSAQEQDHPDMDSVVQHMKGHFGEPDADDMGGMSDMDEDDQMDSGDVNRSDSGAY